MGWFMSSAARNAPLFAWLGPLAGLAELGTDGYPRPVRRQMAIVNLMAVLIAVFSAVYAIVFAFYGMDIYLRPDRRQSAARRGRAARAARPSHQRHRRRASASPSPSLSRCSSSCARSATIRAFRSNYIIAAAVAFAIYGMSHFRLVVAVILAGLGIASCRPGFCFRRNARSIAADPALARQSLCLLGGHHLRHRSR